MSRAGPRGGQSEEETEEAEEMIEDKADDVLEKEEELLMVHMRYIKENA